LLSNARGALKVWKPEGPSEVPEDAALEAVPVKPPKELLLGAGACLFVAALLIPWGIVTIHWAGYFLAAVVTIALVARFRMQDQRRRQNPYYTPQPSLARSTPWILAATYVVAIGHAWSLATHYAS
jgi:hypothetical protein